MFLDSVMVSVGLVLLIGGAWLTVRAAANLAALLGMSPVLIGATVVAFGTSAPELLVNVVATARDSDGLAFGNVLGSNVTNVALVLGISALIVPMSVHGRLLRWEIPVLGAATLAILLFAADGTLSRLEAMALFAGIVSFIVFSLRLFPEGTFDAAEVDSAAAYSPQREAALLVAGLVAISAGADLLVRGSTGLAEAAGISEVAIGVLIVALGTSLPEVTTSVVAAARREHDIAVANVVGSNVFNLLGVVGVTAMITPLDISQDLYQFEMWALAASTAVLLPLAWPRALIGRPAGAMLVAGYLCFTLVVLLRGG